MRLSMIWLYLCLLTAGRAYAQGAPVVAIDDNSAVVNFPEQITFNLAYTSATPVTAATLSYHVEKFSCVAVRTEVPATIADGRASWTWEMIRSGNPPPGAQVAWSWDLRLADGSSLTTPEQHVTLTDDRFAWRKVTAPGLALNWYEGDEVGPVLLDAAESALRRLEDEMGIQLQQDVTFYIYASADDMRQAVLYLQDWAGGVAFSPYSTILIGVPPRTLQDYGVRTVAHELTHLVVGQFGRSCVGGSRPTWLEEGLASVAEGDPDSRIENDLTRALRDDSFLPLRSLNGAFPAHNSAASLAYSQSYSVVQYLLNTYGEAPMQALILALADGLGYDDALQQTYGFNVDGLDVAWRAAIGAAPRAIPPTPTPLSAAAIPTTAPLAGLVSVPTPAATEGTDLETAVTPESAPPTSRGVCGLGLAPLALAVWLARRRQLIGSAA